MKRNGYHLLTAIIMLFVFIIMMPLFVLAETNIAEFSAIPYTNKESLQTGEKVSIIGTPDYNAAYNDGVNNYFGFVAADGIWYISIGESALADFQAAVPSEEITIYGFYSGLLSANGMPVIDIQQGAILTKGVLCEIADVLQIGHDAAQSGTNKSAGVLLKERVYYKAVEDALFTIQQNLNVPGSFHVNRVVVQSMKEYQSVADLDENYTILSVFIHVDYTCRNRLGAELREYAYSTPSGFYYQDGAYTDFYRIAMGRNDNYYCVGDSLYKKKDIGELVFEVDLDDYQKQEYLLPGSEDQLSS